MPCEAENYLTPNHFTYITLFAAYAAVNRLAYHTHKTHTPTVGLFAMMCEKRAVNSHLFINVTIISGDNKPALNKP